MWFALDHSSNVTVKRPLTRLHSGLMRKRRGAEEEKLRLPNATLRGNRLSRHPQTQQNPWLILPKEALKVPKSFFC
ncbi:MAG: hypothetical protein ACTSWP_01875 [Candidatus Freyarchaeota archaeon]|nr:hypothetical protein [Candidatus Freyrarchaeum guaymaensis]